MAHPIPQDSEGMIRDTLGIIARAARDIEDYAMQKDIASLKDSFDFMRLQMEKIATIQNTIRHERKI